MAEYRIKVNYEQAVEVLKDAGFDFIPVGQLTTVRTFPYTGHFNVRGESYPVAFMDRGKIINLVNGDKPGFDSYHGLVEEALREADCIHLESWASEIYHWADGVLRSEKPQSDGFAYQFGNSMWQVNPGAAILRQVEADIGGRIERAVLPEGIFVFDKRIPDSEIVERAYRKSVH